MELYALNQFYRQLGYCQDIPFPPLFSFNHNYPLRFMIGDSNILIAKHAEITNTSQTMILPDPPFRLSCTPSYRSWWQDYFHPRFLGVLDNVSALAPPPLTKRFEEKQVAKESEDLESAMAAQISKPDLPRRAPKTQVKRKLATPADSTEENTPSMQRRTEGIKRLAVKPFAAKKLIKSASPSRSTSTTKIETQPDKTEDVPFEPAATTDPVEDISAESSESNSGPSRTKFGDGSSPATKSVAVNVSMIDDDLENELLDPLDMLMDPSAKFGSATYSKGKAVAEEVNLDIDLPSQEHISFAIMTLQELLDGDPSHFCKVSDQPVAFEAAQILSRAPQLSPTQQKF
ncbi:hypothetical protein SLEP1_g18696 [Rubroshorea leprosula]|uniref:Uncharacterized protein n=1 Tax=Rubroshorea leprosula TaxID=152421 RepID=A0AAV5J7L3_9ROSI|nr:hypothetical protein SLEP1_g18696 [Rubroshorea leprosula]